jgi:hypothetical protein
MRVAAAGSAAGPLVEALEDVETRLAEAWHAFAAAQLAAAEQADARAGGSHVRLGSLQQGVSAVQCSAVQRSRGKGRTAQQQHLGVGGGVDVTTGLI